MNTLFTARLLALATLGPMLAASASAQDDAYWYGGLGAGQSRAKIDEARINASVLGAGQSTTSLQRDSSDTGYKVFGGYQFNRWFGVETSYVHLGKFGYTANTTPTGSVAGQLQLQGAAIDAVVTLPVGESFALLGRVGTSYLRTRDRFTTTGAATVSNANPSEREANVKLGAGMQFSFSRNLMLRAEAEAYRANDAVGHRGRINMYSLSLVMPFGRAPESSRRAMTAPAYVAPMPMRAAMAPAAPPPVAVAVAEPTVMPKALPPRRVSYSAESMFSFDRSTLRSEGASGLDTFISELQGTQYQTVTVEGHTDRLGSTAYNQKLSQERAETVRAYLTAPGRLDPAKVMAVGKGESTPVTAAGACPGTGQGAALVACLQPDRRVEIEVTGTRP